MSAATAATRSRTFRAFTVNRRLLPFTASSSVTNDVSGLSHGHFFNAWGLLWKKFYAACACSLCRSKKKDKIYHILDGRRLAESDEFSYRLPAPLRELINQWLDDEGVPASGHAAANRLQSPR